MGGKNTIEDDEMPFVNRYEELWQIFSVNAENHDRIVNTKGPIKNFRFLRLLFCVQVFAFLRPPASVLSDESHTFSQHCFMYVQYYGGGKTTLGEAFPSQLHDEEVQTFFEGKLKLENNKGLRPEWDLLAKDQIKRILIDVRSEPSIVKQALRVVSGRITVPELGAVEAAHHLIEYAQANGPTLFHFDEVGSDPDHDLFRLRQLAVAVWAQQWEIKNSKGEMPRIYFLVTGKSTEPFANIGMTGGSGLMSPCGSHFLILDMLSPIHIGDVRRHLQDKTKVKVPLELQGLRAEDFDLLDACLARATGGAPRLLLYTLRALHHLRLPLGSQTEIKTAVFETVYDNLLKIDTVSCEFAPRTCDASARKEFAFLFAFCLRGDHLTATHEISIDGKQVALHTLLRFQSFFLSRDEPRPDPSAFTLRLPLYHLKAAERKFSMYPHSVPMLLLSMAGETLRLGDAWRVFELLPLHIVAVTAALDSALGRQPANWAEALPTLFGNSNVAKRIAFDLGPDPFLVTVTANLHEFIKCEGASAWKRGALVPVDMSSTADLAHLQQLVEGNGHGVVEWQQKLFVESSLQLAMVRDEVAKCVKDLPAVLVIFAATVGPELCEAIDAAEGRVLVLPSWNKKTAAEFVFRSAGKSATAAAAEERKPVLLWRAQKKKGLWCVFPGQGTTLQETGKGAHVVVWAGLEVVIPHHDVVRALVDAKTFDALKTLAVVKNPDAHLPS